jgi:hypothetical protein
MMRSYRDYLNAEIERKQRNPLLFTESEIHRLKNAKKLKRKDINDISVGVFCDII